MPRSSASTMTMSGADAGRASQFAEFKPYWFEEALHPDDYDGYAKLTSLSPIRIAAGEQDVTLAGFERLLDCGLDIVQPDVARVGGLTNMRRIGQLAMLQRKPVIGAGMVTKSGFHTIERQFRRFIAVCMRVHLYAGRQRPVVDFL